MEIRKTKHVTDIIDYVKDVWQLSIREEEVLDSVLILLSRQNNEKLEQVEHLLNDEDEELLITLRQRAIENYACREFGLVSANDENDLVDALDDLNFDWVGKIDENDIINSLEESGYIVTDSEGVSDIVEEMQLEEMKDLFLSFSAQKREEVINGLKNG